MLQLTGQTFHEVAPIRIFVHQLYQPLPKNHRLSYQRFNSRCFLEAKKHPMSSPRVAGFQQNCCCTAPDTPTHFISQGEACLGFGHNSIPCNSANPTNFSRIAVSEKRAVINEFCE